MTGALDGVRVALVLAGGNALGAYQAGVYQALEDHGVAPHWIVGTSAGAINGAVIAGNAPGERATRLRALWRPETDGGWPMWWDAIPESWRRTGAALETMVAGRPGLFAPVGSAIDDGGGATPALYDTRPMLASLDDLVDFDRLNSGAIRYAAAAVDLESGEEVMFDSAGTRIGADHVRASAAMPPSFPAVPVDGRLFVDGGLSANLPLDPVLSPTTAPPTLCIAVDLLPRAARRPTTLGEAIGRTQDLIFASQSRRTLARWRHVYAADEAYRGRSVTVLRLNYAGQDREVAGKAMDFSPKSIRDRWDAGHRDAASMIEGVARGQYTMRETGLIVHDPPGTG